MARPKKHSFATIVKTKTLWLILKALKIALFVIATVCYNVGLVTVQLLLWLLMFPFRTLRFMWHNSWGRKWIFVMLFVLVIYAVSWGVKQYLLARQALAASERHIATLQAELYTERDRNEAIAMKLSQGEQSDRGRHISAASKEYIKSLVIKTFGSQADTALRVFNCESGLSPFNVNTKNAPGLGIDGGVAQINERWHKARFEKMYGVPYEIGVYDPELNLKYAKFVQENSGWGAWVCARIVKAT